MCFISFTDLCFMCFMRFIHRGPLRRRRAAWWGRGWGGAGGR